mgnify:CR=1 FL=1
MVYNGKLESKVPVIGFQMGLSQVKQVDPIIRKNGGQLDGPHIRLKSDRKDKKKYENSVRNVGIISQVYSGQPVVGLDRMLIRRCIQDNL